MRRLLTIPATALAVLALGTAAQAANPKDGTFKGKTAQKADVTLKVKNRVITEITFFGYCKNDKERNSIFGYGFGDQLDGDVESNGRFSEREAAPKPPQGNGEVTTFRGRFTKPGKAKGTLRFKGGPCDTGDVKFTVKRR